MLFPLGTGPGARTGAQDDSASRIEEVAAETPEQKHARRTATFFKNNRPRDVWKPSRDMCSPPQTIQLDKIQWEPLPVSTCHHKPLQVTAVVQTSSRSRSLRTTAQAVSEIEKKQQHAFYAANPQKDLGGKKYRPKMLKKSVVRGDIIFEYEVQERVEQVPRGKMFRRKKNKKR